MAAAGGVAALSETAGWQWQHEERKEKKEKKKANKKSEMAKKMERRASLTYVLRIKPLRW